MIKKIKVLISDKMPLIRLGIFSALINEENLLVVEETNGEVIEGIIKVIKPDIFIFGLEITDYKDYEILNLINQNYPKLKVLLLTNSNNISTYNLISVGVVGLVFKKEEIKALVSAVRAVAQGNTWFNSDILQKLFDSNMSKLNQFNLTNREKQILSKIGKGWDNSRIASDLNLGKQTIRNYISRIYSKIEVNSRVEAVLWVKSKWDLRTYSSF